MKRIISVLITVAMILSICLVPASAAYSVSVPAAGQVVTQRDPLNIHTGAGTSYRVVAQAPKGSYLQIIGESGSFYKVVYNTSGSTGYAAKQYLKIVSTGTGTIATQRDPLVLRGSASTSGSNLAQIPKGKVVPLLGKSSDGKWLKVVYGNKIGWCAASYISVAGSSTSTAKKTTITFSSISNPGTITQGNGVHISGTITSTNSKLTSVTASIVNASGKTVVSKTVNPNSYSYSVYNSALDYAMTFGSLSAGNYTLKYDAKTADGTKNSKGVAFVVKAASTAGSSADVPSANIFVYQGSGTSYCTAASAAMLVRADLALQGKSYSGITLNSVLSSGWSSGLKWDFWVGNAHLKSYSLTGTATEKQKKVTSLLASHPEGIVLYGWTDRSQHAVYMASNQKILDPFYNSKQYRNLSESASSASDNWGTINRYWIIVN